MKVIDNTDAPNEILLDKNVILNLQTLQRQVSLIINTVTQTLGLAETKYVLTDDCSRLIKMPSKPPVFREG